jgi:hypothetical protein
MDREETFRPLLNRTVAAPLTRDAVANAFPWGDVLAKIWHSLLRSANNGSKKFPTPCFHSPIDSWSRP